MKRLFALLLAALMVLSMAACGGNTNDTDDSGKKEPRETVDPMVQISGTYVMDSYTENGEPVDEDTMALFESCKYILNKDGTCVYGMSILGTDVEVNGTFTLKDDKLTITLDYGEEEEAVAMEFTVEGDTIVFTEEVEDYTTVQTFKKEA